MRSFAKYLLEKPQGLYVGVKFSDKTVDNIVKWLEDNNIPTEVPRDKFHSTVVYSKVDVDYAALGKLATPVVVTPPYTFQIFKSQTNNWNCLVLCIKSQWLDERHEMANKLGATYDFPEYIPHITMTYRYSRDTTAGLTPPSFPIEIVEEYATPIDFDWNP